MIFDLGNLLVNLWKVWKEDRAFQDWLRLVLSCIFSGFIALTGAWGLALVKHASPWVAFGAGLVACATAVFSVLLRMKQGRGLMLTVPSAVEKQYETSGESVSEPEK